MESSFQSAIENYIQTLDQRLNLAAISIDHESDQLVLHGQVLWPHDHEKILELVRQEAPQQTMLDQIEVLRPTDPQLGLMRWAVADVRQEPHRASELITQVSYGQIVELLKYQPEWWFVRLPDGYLGWVSEYGISTNPDSIAQYKDVTHVVCRRFQPIYGLEGRQTSLLPWGTELPIAEFRDGMAYWTSPGGQPSEIAADSLIPIEDRPGANYAGCQETLEQIMQFIGIPYLWGGTTTYGFDCSGLAQAFYAWMNIPLLRDADQQLTHGREVARSDIQAGDLLFWAARETTSRKHNINHISIAIDSELMIHANQRRWATTIDPIDEIHQRFVDQDHPGLIAIKRLVQN